MSTPRNFFYPVGSGPATQKKTPTVTICSYKFLFIGNLVLTAPQKSRPKFFFVFHPRTFCWVYRLPNTSNTRYFGIRTLQTTRPE